jgi:hypothetical protein
MILLNLSRPDWASPLGEPHLLANVPARIPAGAEDSSLKATQNGRCSSKRGANAEDSPIDLDESQSALELPAIRDAKCYLAADSGQGQVESRRDRCPWRAELRGR